MRYAILSDIHSNLPALEAVLRAVAAAEVERIVCLGDIVGYGAWPAECVTLMRESGCLAVPGNHDTYLVHPDERWLAAERSATQRQNPVVAGIRHARATVDADGVKWLASLPMVICAGNSVFAHAALHGGATWPYLHAAEDARATLPLLRKRVGFFGHTHRENAFCGGSAGFKKLENGVFHFPPACRPAAVTIGSVGQPRSGDPRAHWAIWDSRTAVLRLRRTPYRVHEAALGFLEAGLPKASALRLFGDRPVDPEVLLRLMDVE